MDHDLAQNLRRIAEALERRHPEPPEFIDLTKAEGFLWSGEALRLEPVTHIARVKLDLLKGVDRVKAILLANTRQFSQGRPANNALLWGARGMGKSSLVKAVHGQICAEAPGMLKLIEIHREDLASLPILLRALSRQTTRALIFCDDLSFDAGDTTYKSLKAALEGGLEGRPANVLFYATSNRRHLMPRDMTENEGQTAIHPGEAVEEKVSLSDRFGLWLGFHPCSEDDYLAMVGAYVEDLKLNVANGVWRQEALVWSRTRGARSGRVAWQFVQDLAGRDP